jgi:Tat protein translocase TatB subunit
MFDLGIQELVVIFVVALLVFGPKRLPELARTMGKGVGQLRKAMFEIKTEVQKEMEPDEGRIKQGVPSRKQETSPGEADEAAGKTGEGVAGEPPEKEAAFGETAGPYAEKPPESGQRE